MTTVIYNQIGFVEGKSSPATLTLMPALYTPTACWETRATGYARVGQVALTSMHLSPMRSSGQPVRTRPPCAIRVVRTSDSRAQALGIQIHGDGTQHAEPANSKSHVHCFAAQPSRVWVIMAKNWSLTLGRQVASYLAPKRSRSEVLFSSGSMPSRSLTAFCSFCLQPRYRSVVWIDTCPSKNWI